MRELNLGSGLGNVHELLKKDFRDVFTKNPIVVLTLLAIIILPSLYALINIQACWDPYDNTGNLEFAVANLDKGATFDGEKINVGDQLEDELKRNDDFYWTFVSEDELREGVNNGTYYAGIVIPKNFSSSIKSITSDDPHSAELEYIVNRKSNPMASKLSDSAARAVYNKVNAKIVQFINVAAYEKLGDLQSALASGASQMSSGAGQLSAGASKVQSGASQVKSGANDLKKGANDLSAGSSQVKDGSSQISSSANQISAGSSQVQESAKQLDSSVDESSLPDQIKPVVHGSKELANASSDLAGASSNLAQGSSKLANGSVDLANGASSVATGGSQLADGSVSLAAGSALLANGASSALYSASSGLAGAADSLSSITGVNESEVGEYIYSPVVLKENELYAVPDYGSEVAPFYLVLSMWVGAIITCVMLRTGQSTGTKYTPSEMYFGKLLIFLVMAVLETTVTLIGAFILGIKMTNPLLFVLSAYFIALIFMLICYSLISALGHIGKGLAVIWLVFQISGTGGIYPIQLMGEFLQVVSPYMPMTHGITLLRETALGLIWSNYIPSFLILIAMGAITLVLALVVKMFADKRAHWFEEKLNETDLF
ncbi:MAG: YhgE/Pip domain-containing protein [Methanobrevibacter ruminantium]|uniref:YhgE/Pip domain-containing protein n=1 Tax=Methanobrevibacter ruminantium TaxID=83816 RepID=UPI0026EB99AD|nr:YhgE/Pip domain-containing protein [Methanobrevibacter ruminantium]MCI5737679.1 YhgE/Pip domain-containing protein [Methanobrevibacter ruminantium]MDD6049532.1 YhgE/Pip domain-containing protein [Methanobrevibacter ruminantium]